MVESAKACLRPDGKFCAFSPCMEQIQRTSDALRAASFTDIRCIECLLRFYDVRTEYYSVPAPPVEAAEVVKDGGSAGAPGPDCVEAGAPAAGQSQHVETCDVEPTLGPRDKDAADASLADEKQNPKNDAGEGRGVKRKHRGAGRHNRDYTPWVSDGTGTGGKKLEKLVTIPRLSTKGHTGYLLFGRKPVVTGEQRVNGAGMA